MRVVKVEATFSREELEGQKEYNEEGHYKCAAIDCVGIDCDYCPLNCLSREEVIEYIEKHLE